ncbi:MAG: hypothetical protein IJA72_00895 [Clostridia bacterium]|nr:hypothetical protein [Clostridia bacterium]
MFCKTIILSNSSNLSNAPKGILTLSKDSNRVKGKIRLYNISALPINTKIGLYINQQVYTATITKKPNHYEFDLNENLDISQSIYCALIDNNNHDKKVLLEGGSFNGFYFTDSPFDAVLEAKDEQLEKEIDTAIKQSENCEVCNCENCEYKKYFYSMQNAEPQQQFIDNTANNQSSIPSACAENVPTQLDDCGFELDEKVANFQSDVISKLEMQVDKNNSLDNIIPAIKENTQDAEFNKQQTDFLNDIVYQLDELFNKHPKDETLNNIIPNSKFISVDGDNPYVLGTIYENDVLKYIAYGVAASYSSNPPADLGKHYQWLPLNPNDVMSDGYFMVFQDAVTGTLVEIEFQD